jgi:hypothetical protein
VVGLVGGEDLDAVDAGVGVDQVVMDAAQQQQVLDPVQFLDGDGGVDAWPLPAEPNNVGNLAEVGRRFPRRHLVGEPGLATREGTAVPGQGVQALDDRFGVGSVLGRCHADNHTEGGRQPDLGGRPEPDARRVADGDPPRC